MIIAIKELPRQHCITNVLFVLRANLLRKTVIPILEMKVLRFWHTKFTPVPVTGRPSLMAQTVKNPPTTQETQVRSLGWKIPWRGDWLPTPVFLPGKFYGQRSLEGTVSGVTKSQTCWATSRQMLPFPFPFRFHGNWKAMKSERGSVWQQSLWSGPPESLPKHKIQVFWLWPANKWFYQSLPWVGILR